MSKVINLMVGELGKPLIALDVGSGKYPCNYIGCEWTHMDPFPNPHVEVIGVGTAIPFPDRSFDYVRNSCVIEHMNEMKRVLRDGGLLETVVGDLDNLIHNATERGASKEELDIEIGKLINGVEGPGMKHTGLYSSEYVQALYKEVGLEILIVNNVFRAPRDIVIIGRK
jgi:SAM-dependent methyltransferase